MNGDYDKCGDDNECDDEAHTVWGGSDCGSVRMAIIFVSSQLL